MTEEEGKEPNRIDTGGGASIGGSVHTGGGTFIGRDQIIISGRTTTPEAITRELGFRFVKLAKIAGSLGDLLWKKSPVGVVRSDADRLRKHLLGEGGGDQNFQNESTEYLLSVFTGKLVYIRFPQEFLDLPDHQNSFNKLKEKFLVDPGNLKFPDIPFDMFEEVHLVLRWIDLKAGSGRHVPVNQDGKKVLWNFSKFCVSASGFCKGLDILFDTYHEWEK